MLNLQMKDIMLNYMCREFILRRMDMNNLVAWENARTLKVNKIVTTLKNKFVINKYISNGEKNV